jgi:hypothetical protein
MIRTFEWEYLPLRLCIGVWVGIILMVLVITDASAVVCYITRFTEENFALLIAVIFIKSAIEKVIGLGNEFPIHETDCFCDPINKTEMDVYGSADIFTAMNKTYSYNKFKCNVSISLCLHSQLMRVRFFLHSRNSEVLKKVFEIMYLKQCI